MRTQQNHMVAGVKNQATSEPKKKKKQWWQERTNGEQKGQKEASQDDQKWAKRGKLKQSEMEHRKQ